MTCPALGTEASQSSPYPQQSEHWGHGHGSDLMAGKRHPRGQLGGEGCTCSGMGVSGQAGAKLCLEALSAFPVLSRQFMS